MKFVQWLRISSVILGVAFVSLSSTVRAQNTTQGQIIALIVSGEVKVVPGGKGTPVALKHNDIIKEGDIVMAGKDGVALLAFSNGAAIRITPNAQLGVTKYTQANFDEKATGTFLRIVKDPSQSITELDCRNGTVSIMVKPLDVAAGSKFNANTPAGSFNVTDGLFSVAVVRNPATGQVQKLLGNSYVGTIAFSPVVALANKLSAQASTPIAIPAGGQLQVHLANEPTTGTVSNQIFGAGIPQNTSQYANMQFYAAMYASVSSSLSPVAAPLPPLSSPPPGLPLADFDPNIPPPVTMIDNTFTH